MDFFESEVLKGKYFTPKSRDRLRATMVNLFILAGAFVMLLYAYENLIQGYYVMLLVELIIVFVPDDCLSGVPLLCQYQSHFLYDPGGTHFSAFYVVDRSGPGSGTFTFLAGCIAHICFLFFRGGKGHKMEYEYVHRFAIYPSVLLCDRGRVRV